MSETDVPDSTLTIRSAHGDYEVRHGTGLLASLAGQLDASFPGARRVLLTDSNVERLHGAALRTLAEETLVVPAGEPSKRWAMVEQLMERLSALRFGRNDLLIAAGGGVITDLGGFVAATFHRGMRWVALPTSLLAQVDAAIGGKVAVDLQSGKNLAGAFHPPRLVVADAALLATLPLRERWNGLAEVVKAALLGDLDLLALLEAELEAMADGRNPEALQRAMSASVAFKAQLVTRDEHERGPRADLNLGHTLGHALETETGHGPLLHGEAVVLGLRYALRLSHERARLGAAELERALALLARFPSPPPMPRPEPERLLRAMARDKKGATFVLLKALGTAERVPGIPREALLAALPAALDGWNEGPPAMRVLVLHGPNLNLLGEREPSVYGAGTLAELDEALRAKAAALGLELRIAQSNHEGVLIDRLHAERGWMQGLVINPGALGHTSHALADAIAAVRVRTFEVHLSDTHAREPFRRVSTLERVVEGQIRGLGFGSYLQALERLRK